VAIIARTRSLTGSPKSAGVPVKRRTLAALRRFDALRLTGAQQRD
jgi:hypothetical protein